MGLFRKISEARMKDPVEGTVRVTGITMPDPTATSANFRLDGVVSGPGITPQAVVHHGMMSSAKWPSIGQDLPVTVDRQNPSHFVIEKDKLVTGRQQAVDAAEALAQSMRQQQVGSQPGGQLPRPGPAGPVAGAGPVDPEAMALAQQLAAQFGGASSITINGVPVAAGTGTAGGVAGLAGLALSPPMAVSNADLLARGVAGYATLLGTYPSPSPPSPSPAPLPDRTSIGLMLNVLIDGRTPYQTQTLYAVPTAKLGRLVPGALLPVKVDPTVEELVGIDWDAF